MALTNRKPNFQHLQAQLPEATSLSPERVRFSYDRPTDTLFVDFMGEAVAAASMPLDRGDRDFLFLRVDPETEEVVGLQIEHFLSYAVVQHPELLAALATAALIGITREEINQLVPTRQGQLKQQTQADVLESLMRLSA